MKSWALWVWLVGISDVSVGKVVCICSSVCVLVCVCVVRMCVCVTELPVVVGVGIVSCVYEKSVLIICSYM